MKLLIDRLDSATGWTVNSPSTIQEVQEKSYIAGLNDTSLMITFNGADAVKTASKTFSTPFDVSDYETLIFSIWSQSKGDNKFYLKASDFSYKITLDGIKEYYIPAYSVFTHVNLGIEDVTEINRITITARHNNTDSIIISEMIAEKEEIEIDVLNATKEALDFYINKDNGEGRLIGTLSASVGDSVITMSNPEFLDRYGVVKIIGGGNEEIHQIEDNDRLEFSLNGRFDGATIKNNYTNANVYLQYSSFINPGQSEIMLPGFAIWGIDPEPILRGGKLDTLRTSFDVSGGSKERVEGQIYKYTIQIDCDSRSQELIAVMSKSIRRFIALEVLWINGRRHSIYFSGSPTESKPNEGVDYIPSIKYNFDVEIIENIFDRVTVPDVVTTNLTVDSVEEI